MNVIFFCRRLHVRTPPDNDRDFYGNRCASLVDKQNNEIVRRLIPIAERMGCSMAQLAIAWTMASVFLIRCCSSPVRRR